MIWHWLRNVVLFLKLVLWPLKPEDIARIDPNAKCPSCGATSGELRCVHRKIVDKTIVFVQHRCKVDGARWFEKTIVEGGPDKIHAAIPRTDTERVEDNSLLLLPNREKQKAS